MAHKEKGVQVSATIPPSWDGVLEDHRWQVRMTKTQLVRAAIQEYLAERNLLPDEPAYADTDSLHTPEDTA